MIKEFQINNKSIKTQAASVQSNMIKWTLERRNSPIISSLPNKSKRTLNLVNKMTPKSIKAKMINRMMKKKKMMMMKI